MNIVTTLLLSPRWIVIGICLLALFAALIVCRIDKKKGINQEEEEIFTTSKLHEELNEEREKRNETSLPQINPLGGTNTLARRDKSFSSSIDFFVKLFKKHGDK